jgi:hypothetical protein
MSQRKITTLLRKAKSAQKKIDDAKGAYKELDALVLELRRLKFKGNQNAIIRDNFKKKSTSFKTVSFQRYKLEFLK